MHISIDSLDNLDNPETNKKVLIPIMFDLYGNLYFEFKTVVYQVNIDNKNWPILEKGDYTITDVGIEVQQTKCINESDEEVYGDFIDEDVQNEYGIYNKRFIFSNNSSIPINSRRNGDVAALYNTFIYVGEKLHFKSESSDESTYFSIKVGTDGTVSCGTAYVTERVRKLVVQNSELILI
jgi:hypothetical protein